MPSRRLRVRRSNNRLTGERRSPRVASRGAGGAGRLRNPRAAQSASFKSIDIELEGNNMQPAFSEIMSGGEGFIFNYATASVSAACRHLRQELPPY
jgi:hypothetical protein